MEKKQAWPRGIKALYYLTAIFIFLIIVCLVLNRVVNRRISQSLEQVSSGLNMSYSSISTNVLNSSVTINDLSFSIKGKEDSSQQHKFSFGTVTLTGLNFFKLMSSKKLEIEKMKLENSNLSFDHNLSSQKISAPAAFTPFNEVAIDEIELTDFIGSLHTGKHEDMSLEGGLILKGVQIDDLKKSLDKNNIHLASIKGKVSSLEYKIPGKYQSVQIKNLEVDSKESTLTIDTCRIVPRLDKFEMGRKKGYQVDYVEGTSTGIEMEKLDVMELFNKKLIAEKIKIDHNDIYVFRDRRLPLKGDNKDMPMEDLESLPMSIRVQSATVNASNFSYEEFPKKGNESGILKILRMHASIAPLINHPQKGDPPFITLKASGSLMGSGTVTTTMEMPFQKDQDYKVQGEFKKLDLTKLNASAENLGRIHIESGMLDYLGYQFDMNKEKATGKIVGEYHDLVIDKLKDKTSDKKVDKIKSFFLKQVIIPKNKDKSLAESKRTGKVSYNRDPTRYFSYYMLHSLLTGVKASFTLGFLLPG
ncbi:MAG: hypothetical protein C5B59_05695 [Bacteroidetes bacterium]|nr:MAG: hypothetical protein C5B59_05695 [Bacteroidota bacterium]